MRKNERQPIDCAVRDKLKYESMNKIQNQTTMQQLTANLIQNLGFTKLKTDTKYCLNRWKLEREENFLVNTNIIIIAFYNNQCNSFNKMKMVTEPRFKHCSSALAKLSKVRRNWMKNKSYLNATTTTKLIHTNSTESRLKKKSNKQTRDRESRARN